MQRFGDRGDSYQTLVRAVFTPEDQEARRRRDWNKFTGVLKGRPADLLNPNAAPQR
jgi:hypothetical protein